MKLNACNLNVVTLVQPDKDMSILNNVHIAEDGTTIGANRKALITVEPATTGEACKPVTVSADTINEVLRAIPKNSKFKELLEGAEIIEKDNKILFLINDGMRTKQIEAKKHPYEYIDYKETISNAASSREKGQYIINLKRLTAVIKAFNKICPASGEFPIYMDTTEKSLILRMEHPRTKQHIICIMDLSDKEDWLEYNEWDRKMMSTRPKSKLLKRVK